MTISATVIADSISPAGIRLTTFQLRYPRFIHAELMTHRVFSRNASSSRAIPVAKMIEDLRRDPAMPIYWGSNKPGMQAGAELEMHDLLGVKCVWIAAMEDAIAHAETLMNAGLHKQIANRILEPWAHINVVVTATDWENFFTLRRHKDAQPELRILAELMYDEMVAGQPKILQPGDWHLPYLTDEERLGVAEADGFDIGRKVSVARCARVSYLTHDGRQTTVEEDLALFDRLVGAQPLHASPAEHQATPDEPAIQEVYGGHGTVVEVPAGFVRPDLHGNLRGWIQYRKMLPGEFVAG